MCIYPAVKTQGSLAFSVPSEASPSLPSPEGPVSALIPNRLPQQCFYAKELVPPQHACLNLTNLPTKLNRGGRS